jgi:hypothetical protein
MPIPQELLVIVLLLAVAVVYGYFYLKKAQARRDAKTTAPSTFQAPAAPATGESTSTRPETEPGETAT